MGGEAGGNAQEKKDGVEEDSDRRWLEFNSVVWFENDNPPPSARQGCGEFNNAKGKARGRGRALLVCLHRCIHIPPVLRGSALRRTRSEPGLEGITHASVPQGLDTLCIES